MLELLATAGAAPEQPPFILSTVLPLVGMLGIFYFLVIRPQMKQQKDHREKIEGIKKGDQIVTAGGLVGKVVKVDDSYAEIELAKDVRVKAVKATIGDIIPPGGKAAND
ncbi:MAG: preprotein translocase subunit YajC [Pseudomonadota bacterium]